MVSLRAWGFQVLQGLHHRTDFRTCPRPPEIPQSSPLWTPSKVLPKGLLAGNRRAGTPLPLLPRLLMLLRPVLCLISLLAPTSSGQLPTGTAAPRQRSFHQQLLHRAGLITIALHGMVLTQQGPQTPMRTHSQGSSPDPCLHRTFLSMKWLSPAPGNPRAPLLDLHPDQSSLLRTSRLPGPPPLPKSVVLPLL